MSTPDTAQAKAPPALDEDTVAQALRDHLQGKLEDDKLDAAVSSLAAQTESYRTSGNVISGIVYLRFTLDLSAKRFIGDAGGLSTPGGGALIGAIYTDDLDRLFNNTRSFSFVGTVGYLVMYFYDSNHALLGTGQFGAVSIVSGAGGGTGRWQDNG
jgi:hypothetical protein